MTPAQRGRWTALKRKHRERFYISFTVRRLVDDVRFHPTDYRRYKARAVWPILFKTRDDADTAMSLLPIFANADATATRGRIVSASVEKVRR